MERLLAGSSLKVRAPISESPAVKCERNLSVRRGLMQLAVPGRRTPVPLRCVRWDEGNTAQQGILTYQSEEFMNAVEVRQWECGKSLNYIAAKQGITIRRHYRLGHGSNGTETEKDAPRNILQHIIWDKEVEVAQYKQAIPLETLKKNIKNAPPARDFIGALRESYLRTGFPALIAEVKKASPSKGVLREDFDPVEIAKVYEKNGAACLSILTDKKYFQGSFENLEDVRKSGVQCPLLCKEFVIDSWQIYYARSKGADAILLIAAVLPDVDIMYMTLVCRELGLTAIVEVHNEREMDRVLQIDGIQLIGINNRSLETFEVDISNTKKLLEGERRDLVRKKGIKVVGESGLFVPQDISYVHDAGVRAVLVGESLIKQADPGKAISGLFGKDISK
ncbi:indole-3-glycerol phosphate synthase-like [Zingiber officinale]|uniref:indole-3-glycerol phosphate synthase-like n=1 Tax=Zingiber officinale TaxID=94328 RepID=UPI001C4C1091|nr:indole-3-glycerol phosphate synthase-like [Zingiber officinale]